MQDPVLTLDDDDEIVFMASDAGAQAPADAHGPAGTGDRASGGPARRPARSREPCASSTSSARQAARRFDADNGYVDYERDANADQWIDRHFFADDDPEKLGTSNTGYGPNLAGHRVRPGRHASASSTDRFPRDGVTVSDRRLPVARDRPLDGARDARREARTRRACTAPT